MVLAALVPHPLWGVTALPQLARLYVRQADLGGIARRHRPAFRTKLELAADLVRWAKNWLGMLGEPLWVVAAGGSEAEFAEWERGHWGIENGLHWVLDVAFREDASRTRDLNAGAILAMMRRVAVSLLKRATVRGSVHTRRLIAAWDDDFLFQVLNGMPEAHRAEALPPLVSTDGEAFRGSTVR